MPSSPPLPPSPPQADAPPGDFYLIAHNAAVQREFDRHQLSWAVQYELARGVGNGWWSWDAVRRVDLSKLKGPNITAAQVPDLVNKKYAGIATLRDAEIWTELDREQDALNEGRARSLGLQGDWQEKPNWYGGKVQQIARLHEQDGTFNLVLGRMQSRKSYRFARFLYSRRLLQVSIPKDLVLSRGAELRQFFLRKFVICGRVFAACGSKDNKVFLMETPEDYERVGNQLCDKDRITVEDFVSWHNPLELNGKQAVSKYATRYDLGFSISIFHIDDEYAPHDTPKPEAKHIYTDGCGLMNGAALRAIARAMNLSERPTAVQGRIGGAKGLWTLHPSPSLQQPDGVPKIWIRASQRKIEQGRIDGKRHPAHAIFDLLAPPRVTCPSRLSRLTILNLAHNGVDSSVFVELMRTTLAAELAPLLDWDGSGAMVRLFSAIERRGSVVMKRNEEDEVLWEAIGDMSVEDLEALEALDPTRPPASLRDPTTGQSVGLHAVAMDLVQAGFHPLQLETLFDKLKYVCKEVIESVVRDFHISVPLSAEAFCIPDPTGSLEFGQIHFKSTKNLKDPLKDMDPKIVLGDVLIYRNPVRSPWDVQKVTAVRCEKLAQYTDVIVLPATGPCSFASILAGGDVCVCIYDSELVEPSPPDFMQKNFEDQNAIQQVSALAAELDGIQDRDARRQKLQEVLLMGLSVPPVGQYSVYHENSAFANGYDDPETLRLNWMFTTILDSRKTGHRVREEVTKKDKKTYDRLRPPSLPSKGDAEYNMVPIIRKKHLKSFVLDDLHKAGKDMKDERLKMYEGIQQGHKGGIGGDRHDKELLAPYLRAEPHRLHPALARDLDALEAHIESHIKKWTTLSAKTGAAKKEGRGKGGKGGKEAAASKSAETRRAYDELAREFAAGPDLPADSLLVAFGDVGGLRASWAYRKNAKFAWSVAFGALCAIKASTREPAAVAGEFAELMAIPQSALRVLEQAGCCSAGLGRRAGRHTKSIIMPTLKASQGKAQSDARVLK
ncbi:RNA dependent RNA polymerase-domain-containing protein [Epithele typhae]|uniref:RNA dependent RNA polymerase-domain-containing protein n=1 Tax=Epithele typhae TaxID=378194 RepID=UPI002007B31D|nr:RNA dependent RNA polymerase-domain-containing protein [Epithele typhae]KAH9923183.1 RNA dependent RNA polymerase-domain-containing protein [Epithele typhae]